MILTPSNVISLIRGPLAFMFLLDSVFYRTLAIILAMVTDCLDGYIARRFQKTSRLGATLDPLMDKFFVFFVVAVFLKENQLQMWEAMALMARDFAILFFGFYLTLRGTWSNFQFRSIWSGKITTTMQFFVLWGLILHIQIPSAVFICFIVLGISALIELYFIERQIMSTI